MTITARNSASRWSARVAFAVSVLLTLGIGVLFARVELETSYEPSRSPATALLDILMALSFAVVGALVTLKRPGNLVGWALSLSGFGLLFGGFLSTYAEVALLAKPDAGLPAGAAAAAIAEGSWTAMMAGVFLLLLLFPLGRLPSRRWRPLAVGVLVGFAVVWMAIAVTPGSLDAPFEAFESPLAITRNESIIAPIFALIAVCLLGAGAAAVGLLVRFRRSRGQERQQFKWLAGSAGLLLASFPFAAAFNYPSARCR